MRKTRQEHLIDRTMRKKEEVMFRRQDLKDQQAELDKIVARDNAMLNDMNVIDRTIDLSDLDIVDGSELDVTNPLEKEDGVPDGMESGQSMQFALPEMFAHAQTEHNDDSLRFDSFTKDYF